MRYRNLLDEMVDKSRQIFGENLTGIYLHGSMAMGCFHPDKSDIDLIIVVRNNIANEKKLQFMNTVVELNKTAPAKGIELSIVKEKYCKPFLYPTPFELHFSNAHLQWFTDNPTDYIHKMQGVDKDLAAHFRIIKEYGIVLYGAQIEDVFDDVPDKDYFDSIWFDIEKAEEEIIQEPVYIILNLCRAAAFLKDGMVISKKQGGEWALRNISEKYRTLLENALQSYTLGEEMAPNAVEAREFAGDMLQMIKAIKEIKKLPGN